MTSFAIQGWCPGALRPMLSGDGLVVRIRPRMARLTAAQAQGIAKAALTYGNGLIDLTARANVQLRGIRPETHLALLDDLAALNLLDPDEATERHRNITVSPFWSGDHWQPLANDLTNLLAAQEFTNLPNKFGATLDLDRPMVLQAIPSDIRYEWHPEGWLIRPDGFAFGAVVQTAAQATAATDRLLIWFLAQNAKRMAALSGKPLPPGFDQPMTPSTHTAKPGPHPLGFLAGLEFGQIHADTLGVVANSSIRITPWRMILIEGFRTAPNLPGLITSSDSPLLNVTACTGAPGCPQGLQPTRDLARQLAPHVPPGQHLHVSGCAKGCAHPAPASVTLTGTTRGFDLIKQGRASDPGRPFTSNPFKAP